AASGDRAAMFTACHGCGPGTLSDESGGVYGIWASDKRRFFRRTAASGAGLLLVEQDGHVVGVPVGGGHVEITVAVEIGQGNIEWRTTHGKRLRLAELAAAQVDQHADRIAAWVVAVGIIAGRVGGENIEPAVAVNVAEDDALGHRTGREANGFGEGAVAVAV